MSYTGRTSHAAGAAGGFDRFVLYMAVSALGAQELAGVRGTRAVRRASNDKGAQRCEGGHKPAMRDQEIRRAAAERS